MATSIWGSNGGVAATPAATNRIPTDISSGGAPNHHTLQQLADLGASIGVTTQALGSINTNTTITWSSGSYVTATIAGALTFTFAGAPSSGQGFQGVLVLTNGGSAAITWPGSVTWMGGTAPTLTASGVNVLYFVTSNGGTNWYGWTEYDEPAIAGSDTQVLFNDGGALAGDSGFTFNKTNNTVDLGGATVTASDPVLDLSQTWNSAGVTFTGWKINITDTASSTGSLLADLQVAGTSRFAVQKTGNVRVANGTSLASMYARFPDYFGSPAFALSKNDNDTSYVFHVDTFGTVGYVKIGSTAAYTWASAGTFGTNPTIDLLLFRDAAGTLAQRNGTNAQTFRVYKTYTDASNHARLTVSAGVLDSPSLQIIGESAGTGTYTNVDIGYSNTKLLRQNGTSATLFGQHFVSFSDNTYDIGSSSAGWRTGYFDTSVVTPTIANAGTAILAATRLRADGFATALTSKTADYTATATDTTILVDASGAARTITLPAASGISGRIYVIKKTDSSGNAVTVDADASETIDGATTYTLSAQYKFVVIQCDGTNWHIIGAN